jgi:hypothetical protein
VVLAGALVRGLLVAGRDVGAATEDEAADEAWLEDAELTAAGLGAGAGAGEQPVIASMTAATAAHHRMSANNARPSRYAGASSIDQGEMTCDQAASPTCSS